MSQSNISAKNIARLVKLESIEDEPFQLLRTLVLSIAKAHPRKRKRWTVLRRNHPVLFRRIQASGLFDDLLDEWISSIRNDDLLEVDDLVDRDDRDSINLALHLFANNDADPFDDLNEGDD